MKLSVVIVHYNTSGDLDRLLGSLAAHPPACAHAVTVVDNASSDPGLDEVRARHPGVRWLLNRENVGYARGVNQGLAAAPAEYYLVLNPDIVAPAGAVDALLAYADAHPRAGVVGPQLLNEDGTVQDSCRRFYTFGTLLLRRTILGRLFPRAPALARHLMRDFDHRHDRAVDWVLGGCLLARGEAVARVGPLDERFFLYFEDVDWCWRMWRAGWEVRYAPEPRFTHRHRRASARGRLGGALGRGFWLHLGSLISFYEKWGMVVYLLKKWRGPLGGLLLWGIDQLALLGALLLAYAVRGALDPLFPEPLYPLREYRPLLAFAILLASAAFLVRGRYRAWRARRFAGWGRHARDIGVVTLLLLASTYLGRQQTYSRAVLLLFAPLAVVTTAAGERLFGALRDRLQRRWLSLERTLLVGGPAELAAWLAANPEPRRLGLDLVGYLADAADAAGAADAPAVLGGGLPRLGAPADLGDVAERFHITHVVFWGWPAGEPAQQARLEELRRRRIRLRWCAAGAWIVGAGARAEPFGGGASAVLEPALWPARPQRPSAAAPAAGPAAGPGGPWAGDGASCMMAGSRNGPPPAPDGPGPALAGGDGGHRPADGSPSPREVP